MYTPHFVYSPINGHLGFPFLAIVNKAQVRYKYLLDFLLSILLGIYPEVELLGHMVILCLIFSETVIPFFPVAAHFMLLPTMHTRVPISPHPCQHLLVSSSYFFK